MRIRRCLVITKTNNFMGQGIGVLFFRSLRNLFQQLNLNTMQSNGALTTDATVPDSPNLLSRHFVYKDGIDENEVEVNVARHAASCDGNSHTFRVMQWNILADALSKSGPTENFYKCPATALKWSYRKCNIEEELLRSEADIICLEEVDHYADFFQPMLSSLNYVSFFMPKPDSPCLLYPDNNGPDGCAFFFKSDKFSLVSQQSFVLQNMHGKDTNQVAIVVVLETKCCTNARKMCIVCTHLKSHASKWSEDIRLQQGAFLLGKVNEIIDCENIPLVICGDFNATPYSPTYKVFQNFSFCHLQSAYSVNGAEPMYTTWKFRPDRVVCHTIDYIWYSKRFLSLVRFLNIPTRAEIGADALPAVRYPSDHMALVAELKFISHEGKHSLLPKF